MHYWHALLIFVSLRFDCNKLPTFCLVFSSIIGVVWGWVDSFEVSTVTLVDRWFTKLCSLFWYELVVGYVALPYFLFVVERNIQIMMKMWMILLMVPFVQLPLFEWFEWIGITPTSYSKIYSSRPICQCHEISAQVWWYKPHYFLR